MKGTDMKYQGGCLFILRSNLYIHSAGPDMTSVVWTVAQYSTWVTALKRVHHFVL